MKVHELETPNLVELVMPYEMYRWVLYCMATYDNPKDYDAVELHDNALGFAESLGAESAHHFISENKGFMKHYLSQLVELGNKAEEQAKKVAGVLNK